MQLSRLRSAISSGLGGIFGQNFLVRFAPTYVALRLGSLSTGFTFSLANSWLRAWEWGNWLPYSLERDCCISPNKLRNLLVLLFTIGDFTLIDINAKNIFTLIGQRWLVQINEMWCGMVHYINRSGYSGCKVTLGRLMCFTEYDAI